MKNLKTLGKLALIAVGFSTIIACKKDNNDNGDRSTSRLFVSNAESTNNLSVYSPADLATLSNPVSVNTGATDGNGIVYDANSNIGFQVGRTNKQIKTFSVKADGTIEIKNTFTDASLESGRGAAYDASTKTLYVASNTNNKIHVYNNADSKTGTVTPEKVFTVSGQPWGIHFDAGRLMVLIDNDARRIEVFNNIASTPTGTITTQSIINFPTANRLHGLTYSAKRDILIVTEIGQAAAGGIFQTPFNQDGAIYIIEGANAKIATGGDVTINRTISGIATLLGNPVDVTFDDRDNKNIIYVAEKANNAVLGFKLSDQGNAVPTLNAQVTTRPESVWVDARN